MIILRNLLISFVMLLVTNQLLAQSAEKSSHESTPGKPGYNLLWADEYNTDGMPSETYWSHEQGFQRNQELQGYGFNPFHQPHYLLLNLAIGGNGGDPSNTPFPRIYELDYVRIYQKK